MTYLLQDVIADLKLGVKEEKLWIGSGSVV
jgi:hypothetical protein